MSLTSISVLSSLRLPDADDDALFGAAACDWEEPTAIGLALLPLCSTKLDTILIVMFALTSEAALDSRFLKIVDVCFMGMGPSIISMSLESESVAMVSKMNDARAPALILAGDGDSHELTLIGLERFFAKSFCAMVSIRSRQY